MRNIQESTLYQWFARVWNAGDEAAIPTLMATDAKAHGATPQGTVVGTEAFTAFFRQFREQFHNIQVSVDDVITQDDMECGRTSVTATHTQSNTEVTFTGMCMVRIHNGKIAEAWNNYDFMRMWEQLGMKMG